MMGQREAKERLEHISAQLQHTCTKEQVTPSYSVFLLFSFYSTVELQLSTFVFHFCPFFPFICLITIIESKIFH